MEAGLWSLFVGTLIGMTALAIKNPKLYQRLTFLIGMAGLAGALLLCIYWFIVSQVFIGLMDFIDPEKLEAAKEAKDGWLPSFYAIGGLAIIWLYSAVCCELSRYVAANKE